MSKTQSTPELSKAEYDILRVLWKDGKRNVREVHESLQPVYHWAYTTTKTMMDRMVAKGLLTREEFHGVFLYTPVVSRPAGLAKMVEFFADRVLEMDTGAVVSLFARSKAITPDEIRELVALLKDKKRGD
ncbi:MAG: BlaI/MecI/CopY family transcriptional regulator [bacterium]|nr:BlaI/MecI/CopY family transcriptional regulator [bacterium]